MCTYLKEPNSMGMSGTYLDFTFQAYVHLGQSGGGVGVLWVERGGLMGLGLLVSLLLAEAAAALTAASILTSSWSVVVAVLIGLFQKNSFYSLR